MKQFFSLFFKISVVLMIFIFSFEAKAQQDRGFKAYNKGNYEVAYKEWLKLHRADKNSQAQYNIGLLYRNGQGVSKDQRLAFDWFSRAAIQDHPASNRMVGMMLLENKYASSIESTAFAFGYFEKARKLGDTLSDLYMGNMLRDGEYVTQNKSLARDYYRKAISNGHAQAKKLLDSLNSFEQQEASNKVIKKDFNSFKNIILKYHPDFDEIRNSNAFFEWSKRQSKDNQEWIDWNIDNLELNIHALNLFKVAVSSEQIRSDLNSQIKQMNKIDNTIERLNYKVIDIEEKLNNLESNIVTITNLKSPLSSVSSQDDLLKKLAQLEADLKRAKSDIRNINNNTDKLYYNVGFIILIVIILMLLIKKKPVEEKTKVPAPPVPEKKKSVEGKPKVPAPPVPEKKKSVEININKFKA